MTKTAVKDFTIDVLYDVAGSILFALGLYTFAKNANFAPGGVSGLALIFNHLWNFPIGVTTLVLNIPIVLLSYRVVGRRFMLKSFRTMLISTLFLDLVFPHLPMYTGERILAALFAGMFSGAGLALIYMRGSSTGGSDFLILSIKKLKPHFSVGQVTLFTDSIIILLGGLVYRNVDAVLYGAVSTFAGSTVMDRIINGSSSSKLSLIVTTKGQQIADSISDAIGRGSTLLPGIGTFSGMPRQLLLCVCGKAEVTKVRKLTHEVDPEAFLMVTEVSEVFGEGFLSPHI